MKQVLTTIFACISFAALAQWNTKVEGNGTIKKETRSVNGGFTEIFLSGSSNVELTYGKSNEVQVEGEENILPYIITEVQGNKLVIRTKENVSLQTHKKIIIHASITKLTGASISGSGNINGTGKFENSNETNIKISGSGTIKLNFARINSLKASVTGSGDIILNGSAKDIKASISGSGNIDCSNVTCDNAGAKISGSGNIKINANVSIDASTAGSGNVYYSGSATNITQHSFGSGHIKKA